ncbi:MAG: hypothetical protein JNL01_16510 [Bdellovibrionales bacterium]|nr:hypothetical protein [Bdellovibrionales bacterium]
MDWKIDQLKSELKNFPDVLGWIVSQEHIHRKERYFLNDAQKLGIDQDRDTRLQSIQMRVFVNRGVQGRQGEISVKLFPSLALKPQIDAAIQAAKLTDHQAWALPTSLPEKLPQLKTSDPRIAEDMDGSMDQLTAQIRAAVEKKRESAFNSAELFLSMHHREFHLSNGLTHRSSQSRIYVEAAYSKSIKLPNGQNHADEYLNSHWAVSQDDVNIAALFDETAELAAASLATEKPATGKYPVIVNAEVLSTLWNNQISHFSAANAYNQLPFQKPGTPLIEGATGDLISIWLDPSLDYGADTSAVSSQGIAQKRLQLVDQNKIVATAADLQHATYLSMPATTTAGAVEIGAGQFSHEELTQQAPQVIEILQFSGLFADAQSGTFSSEIRLARLYDRKTKTSKYLKGGSLSGSLFENFKNVRLSKERVKHAHFSADLGPGHGYFGPKYALMNDVSIVG